MTLSLTERDALWQLANEYATDSQILGELIAKHGRESPEALKGALAAQASSDRLRRSLNNLHAAHRR